MINIEGLQEIALGAALALCVEELDRHVSDWRVELSEKAEFAVHDRAVRVGEIGLVRDAETMMLMAKMVQRVLVSAAPKQSGWQRS